MKKINIAILCGGNGTRLWPLSRKKLPKQFLPLVNQKTMFQNTIQRFDFLQKNNKILLHKFLIICNETHKFIVEQQLQELNINNYIIITEPIGRDSAPAVLISSLIDDEENVTAIIPCDHVFDDKEFCNLLEVAVNQYIENSIITFGIKPTYPETGYGYIETNQDNQTLSFKEKPQLETAINYLKNGNYLWNAGVFIFQNKNMIKCFQKYSKDIYQCCLETLKKSQNINNTISLDETQFKTCQSISIDYAIMEKISNDENKTIQLFTLPYLYKWSDVGSFKSLYNECNKDENNNVIKGNIVTLETQNCYIETDKKLVTTIGVENLVIVNTRDALLVTSQEKCQNVKKMLTKLKPSDQDLKIVHAKAYRPWGWYINVEGNDFSGYKIKRIGVYPGKRLSLQSHKKRSEHWVITKGKAKVQLNDDFIELTVNQHIHISVGALHRMENIGKDILEFVETQIGEYLGEDDIIRYQDDFGRS